MTVREVHCSIQIGGRHHIYCLGLALVGFNMTSYLTDILALRFVAGNTITTGEYEKGRDTFAWALAFWTEDMELYPYVLALYVCQICTWLEKLSDGHVIQNWIQCVMIKN